MPLAKPISFRPQFISVADKASSEYLGTVKDRLQVRDTWTLLDDPEDGPREDIIDRLHREYMESHFRALWVALGEIEEEDESTL